MYRNNQKTPFWAIIFALNILMGCGSKPETEVNAHAQESTDLVHLSKEQVAAAGITWAPIQKRDISEILEVNGILDVPPQNMVSVSAMAAGFVEKTQLLQGKKVKKGEVIAVLKNPEFITWQQEYLGNKSRLQFLETEVNRQSILSKEQISAQKDYQKILSEWENLKAFQAGLKEKLVLFGFDLKSVEKGNIRSQLEVVSPISGMVTAVFINLGKFVQPQDVIAEIVNTEHLHAELNVFEADLGKIQINQHLDFFLQSDPSTLYKAHIYLINHKLNADRTIRVHAHLDEESHHLIPNQNLVAKIRLRPKNTWALPASAIIKQGQHEVAFILEDSSGKQLTFRKIEVVKESEENGFWSISDKPDLPNQKPFVHKGAFDLLSTLENKDEEGH